MVEPISSDAEQSFATYLHDWAYEGSIEHAWLSIRQENLSCPAWMLAIPTPCDTHYVF